MRFSRLKETPRMKGKRLYETGRVEKINSDSFEDVFLISGNYSKETIVSFIKNKFEFICFNPECSLWRNGRAGEQICYHIWACRIAIIEEAKK